MPTSSCLALCVILCLIAACGALAAPVYVAPQGDDAWSGSLPKPNAVRTDGPLASLPGARDAVRALKAKGPLAEPVRVVIADGTYVLAEPVQFTPADSGTAECPISYEAAPGAKPVFVGGRVVSGFRKGEGALWVAHIPEVAEGKWYFEQLWVNGRRAVRARTPNVVRCGETCVPRYHYIAGPVGYGIDPLTGREADLQNRAFLADPKDIAPLLKLTPQQLADTNVVVYYAWESARLRPAAVDADTARVVTTGPGTWKFQWLGRERYHLENYREALDEPGEWLLDRDGTLTYWPLPDEDMRKAEVVAPVLSDFVHFTGDPQAGLAVEHITLKGLAFRYAGYSLPSEGHTDGQAAVTVPAAIMADGARNVAIEGCEIGHVGTYGVWFRRGCSDCRVQQTEIHDMGAGGVKIGEAFIQANEADRTHHIVCDNNLIDGGGRLFTGAVGVWVGQSSDNQVTHNDISDLFYTGVSVGWSWGYADTICKRNRTEFNHLHHLGWGVMSDMGGVYTLGIQDGASVSNNVIHDVWSYNKYGYAGLGLYNDEGSTHITMENNLVYDTLDMTYHQHYGKENVIRNNILVNGRNSQVSVHREEPHLSSTFENNIVCFTTGKLFWQPALGSRQLSFDRNLYWRVGLEARPTTEGGEPFDFMGLSLADWQAKGLDVHSVIEDPQFVNVANHDFRLKPTSPALKLGFKPFDYTQAGLYGDAEWVARAHGLKYAPVEFAPDPPPPPPLAVAEDFEQYPVGAQPLNAQLNVEGQGDSIAVTDETAASGKQCLKLTDAEGLKYSFDPHLVYTPDYREGVCTVEFDVRADEGAELWHEYRDWSVNPYTIGPRVQIKGGQLLAADKPLLPVPTGEWFRLAVSVPLGPQADDTWTLTVTLPNEPPQEFADLPAITPGWKHLTWIGFVSNATTKTAIYLDNLKISVK
jgi:hypothetical protein